MQKPNAAMPATVEVPASVQKGTRTQRRTAQMRRNLVDIAEALLIQGGVDAVTAEEVARRADVSLQTVYNRIGGKSALLIAVAEQSIVENRAYMDVAYNAKGSAEERIRLVCSAYVKFAIERPHQFRIIANPPDESEAVKHFAAIAEEHITKLVALLNDAIEEDILSPDLKPADMAVALWAMLNGVLGMAIRDNPAPPKSVKPKDLIETSLRLIEIGLKKR